MTREPRFILFDDTGAGWPTVRLPQVAFAGRSNVGKSSLLNALAGRPGLARVSRTPGRTRGIVVFEVEGRYAFVDLPGYGYARVSRASREAWRGLVEGYLSGCRRLRRVYLLVDARRGPEEEERDLAAWLAAHGVSARWIATKADKVAPRDRRAAAARFDAGPGASGAVPPAFVSTRTGEGIEALRRDVRSAFSS